MKFPFIQFFTRDWLGDPAVSRCEPATRGILFDWLCAMHELDRCGVISATRDELARIGRCSAVQCDHALQDLIRTQAADVTFRNATVTVVNRRMKREANARKTGAERVKRHREKEPCNGHVTDTSQNQITDYIPKVIEHQPSQGANPPEAIAVRKHLTKLTVKNALKKPACERIARELLANKTGCFYDNCKVKQVEINPSSLRTVLEEFSYQIEEKTAYECFHEAVVRTHQAAVDGLVKDSVSGYCIQTFRDLLNKN